MLTIKINRATVQASIVTVSLHTTLLVLHYKIIVALQRADSAVTLFILSSITSKSVNRSVSKMVEAGNGHCCLF